MKKTRYSLKVRKKIFDNILKELIRTKCLTVSKIELKKKFNEFGHSLQNEDYKELDIRKKLRENGIRSNKTTPEEKIELFNKLVSDLKKDKIKIITNKQLILKYRKKFGTSISTNDIGNLDLRNILKENGILSKLDKRLKRDIIDKAIDYILQNNITIEYVADLFRYAKEYGEVSRATINNNLDYIQSKIDITHIMKTKKLKSLDMTNKEIIINSAKYYTKRNVYKLTASEFKCHTQKYYRTVELEVIKSYSGFLKKNYDLEIVNRKFNNKNENIKHNIKEILDFLKINNNKYNIIEVDKMEDIGDINDKFIVCKNLKNELVVQWKLYIDDYIKWLSISRTNVKNGLLNESKELKIDTEKKKLITLSHSQLNINKMTFQDIIHLTLIENKSSDKAYGLHLQNMYIAFLLYLHSKNKIVIPFSYLYDVCFSNKKVQVELPYYLKNNIINEDMLKAIHENRLNVKDDKYKRIFQFFLVSLPQNYPIQKIKYKHLVPLLDRNKNDFKRVSEILNMLGANIVDEKPRFKYVDRYIKYTKIQKYKKLVEIFNKAMNRAYKLGSYAKEKSVYKNWSISYADFFDFLESNYQNEILSESFLYKIFDYPDEENIFTYQEFIQNLKINSNTKDNKFTPLIIAFSRDCQYKSLSNLKDKKPAFDNTSENNVIRKKRGAIKSFVALEKIEDILRNRPPESNYYKKLNIDNKYTDWWKNYDIVAPFEPMILLMHLYIPARGINFRLADRNTFLVKNESGKISGYHFTHDKNKKRKTPYIAPNIWGDDLKIVEDFVEYSKIHFPNQKAIKYDKQNPNGIIPLFPNYKGTSFYTESQHMSYWKRVLLKAQIELTNEDIDEKIILIYPKKPEVEIPKKPEEVDKLSQGYMANFDVRYDLHSLRHTGASKYANAGMPLGLLKLLTGHIDLNVLQLVYIEIDKDKMIKEWEKLQNISLNGLNLVDAGDKLITSFKKVAKDMLLENNSEHLLKFLEDEKFITIGSYLGNDKLTIYEMEDFSKIDPVFWTFKRTGICTSSTCPQGLENRCSLCPHFLTSPVYMHEISAQVNLQNYRLSKYINMIKENRTNGNSENNMSIRTSAQLEMEEMLGWTEILKALDEIRTVAKDEQDIKSKNSMVNTIIPQESLFKLAPIKNSDHSLLKLVYDGLALKQFDHESMRDASEKLVTKLIKYAARNEKFIEINEKDKYEIFEWFRPIYNEVLLLEKDVKSEEKLSKILSFLSDKPNINLLEPSAVKQLNCKEGK